MGTDKKIFLLSKNCYDGEMVEILTEYELEKWVAQDSHENDPTILKIDANGYSSVEEALNAEVGNEFFSPSDYYILPFGF